MHILDVMPTDHNVLGFGNIWYKKAVQNSVKYHLSNDLSINSISAPYFIATKFEAFKTRGNYNLWNSHDYEDIICIMLGCSDIVEKITSSDSDLLRYIKVEFKRLLSHDQFESTLPGHVADGPITMENAKTVRSRIARIVD